MPKAAFVGTVAYLNNSTTKIPKETYVPSRVSQDGKSKDMTGVSGGAVRKSGFIRSAPNQPPSPLLALAEQFEGSPLPAALPAAAEFSNVHADRIAFGQALLTARQKAAAASASPARIAADLCALRAEAEVLGGKERSADMADGRSGHRQPAASSASDLRWREQCGNATMIPTEICSAGQDKPEGIASAIQPQWTGSVMLGMPQLSGVGLSETWLLETCGERHWSMICGRFGAPSQELRDVQGRRVYISFIVVQVASERLDQFAEGDVLQYTCSLEQHSPTRYESVHRWAAGSSTVEVQMLSVFLRRRGDGGNALEEAQPAGALQSLSRERSDLERAFRSQLWSRGERPAILHACSWQPTLALDYNGAGLLYFARYHQIVERAEASVLGEAADNRYALERRDTYYFANLDPGDSVTVGFSAIAAAGAHRRYQAEIRRSGDGRLMARMLVRKKQCAAASDPVERAAARRGCEICPQLPAALGRR